MRASQPLIAPAFIFQPGYFLELGSAFGTGVCLALGLPSSQAFRAVAAVVIILAAAEVLDGQPVARVPLIARHGGAGARPICGPGPLVTSLLIGKERIT